jgi:hypothetical protein
MARKSGDLELLSLVPAESDFAISLLDRLHYCKCVSIPGCVWAVSCLTNSLLHFLSLWFTDSAAVVRFEFRFCLPIPRLRLLKSFLWLTDQG